MIGGLQAAGAVPRPRGLGRAAIDRPILLLLPLGLALSSRGLNVLSDSLLTFLAPAVSAGLATIGALAGLSFYTDRRHEPALGRSVIIDAMLVLLAVGAAALPVAGGAGFSTDAAAIALCLAVAAIPSWPGAVDAARRYSPLPGRVCRLSAAIAIVSGAFAIAWLQSRSLTGSVVSVLQVSGIAATLGVATWLMAWQTNDDTEQRVLAVGTVLLLGGAAEYLGASALFTGLVAGACWRALGRVARERLTRDLDYLQHPLVVLLLLIAGARSHLADTAIALAIVYALARAAAKLASGYAVSRLAAEGKPASLGRAFLPPGVVGVAFALNIDAAWAAPAAAATLDVLVFGAVLGEVIAVANSPRERA